MTTHQQGLRGEHHSARGRPQSPFYAGGSQSSGSHAAGARRPRQDQSTPLTLINQPVKITTAPGTHAHAQWPVRGKRKVCARTRARRLERPPRET